MLSISTCLKFCRLIEIYPFTTEQCFRLIYCPGKKKKHFGNDNASVAHIVQFVFEKVKNIVGKGEIASYKHFLPFQQNFQKPVS